MHGALADLKQCCVVMHCVRDTYFIRSFMHSGYFYSAPSSLLLLSGAPSTTRILCWSFTPKHNRQLRVTDLPKAPTCRLERDSNPRPFGRKAPNLPMSHGQPPCPNTAKLPWMHSF